MLKMLNIAKETCIHYMTLFNDETGNDNWSCFSKKKNNITMVCFIKPSVFTKNKKKNKKKTFKY